MRLPVAVSNAVAVPIAYAYATYASAYAANTTIADTGAADTPGVDVSRRLLRRVRRDMPNQDRPLGRRIFEVRCRRVVLLRVRLRHSVSARL